MTTEELMIEEDRTPSAEQVKMRCRCSQYSSDDNTSQLHASYFDGHLNPTVIGD